jgi:hypothetical protein
VAASATGGSSVTTGAGSGASTGSLLDTASYGVTNDSSDGGVTDFFSSSSRTSRSIVLLRSSVALRNSPMAFPSVRPISGSFRGPNTIRIKAKMSRSSGTPSGPNMCREGLADVTVRERPRGNEYSSL